MSAVARARKPKRLNRPQLMSPEARKRARKYACEYAPLAGFVAIAGAAGMYGALYSPNSANPDIEQWYASQKKARLNPPAPAFGPVWTVLYAMIATAGWRVYRARHGRARTQSLALWGAQMGLNAAWSRLFFGEQAPRAALADLTGMAATIAGFIVTSRKVDRTASRLMMPYLAWVAFAGYLNAEVVRRNH
ncbi:MAG TPA: TspO/MBR family protein [Gemmatimonadaceae bacterium]|jgi:tryptophan-rich sensory protein